MAVKNPKLYGGSPAYKIKSGKIAKAKKKMNKKK